jgi:hypothetical protein|tara:strand:- start:15 stop:296 length:282 start_codon:yes stop_codon:yes gene_type:complete
MSLADNSTWKAVKPFLNGGLSGMGATCIIQPLDIVKVRRALFLGQMRAAPQSPTVRADVWRWPNAALTVWPEVKQRLVWCDSGKIVSDDTTQR